MTAATLVLRSEHYTEGAVLAPDGRLFFSMTRASAIAVADPRDAAPHAQIWAHVPGANGHAIAADGSHVVMASTGALLRLDAEGRTCETIATAAGGAPFVYPNDVALDARRGGFYATDSGYTQTPAHIDGTARGRIVRVDADGSVRVVAGDIAYANGVALAPDGDTLYCSASTTRTLLAYAVAADGSLGTPHVIARTPLVDGTRTVPDGVTVAPNGMLYVAHYGAGEVLVYAPDGTLVRRIAVPLRATSHVALGATCAYVSGGIEREDGPGGIARVPL